MAPVISFSRFSLARLYRESVLAEQRDTTTAVNRESANTDYRASVTPEYRANVFPIGAFPSCEVVQAQNVTTSSGSGQEDCAGQHPVAGMYAGYVPVVGPLSAVLEAMEQYHLLGIRTGLTRLRKGVWEIAPRSMTA